MELDIDVINNIRELLRAVFSQNIYSKVDLAGNFDVSENTIQNFLRENRAVRKPNTIFLRRVAIFLYTTRIVNRYFYSDKSMPQLAEAYKNLEETIRWNREWFDMGDSLSRLVPSAIPFRDLTNMIAGDYYAYRMGESCIMRSHIHIPAFDPYRRVPTFENLMDTDNGTRYASGRIYAASGQLIFNGVIKQGAAIFGQKLIVLPYKFSDNVRPRYDGGRGIFVSSNADGAYEVGPIVVIRTKDTYQDKHTGMKRITEFPDVSSDLVIPPDTIADSCLKVALKFLAPEMLKRHR